MKCLSLILFACLPMFLCSCVTKASNDAYEGKLNAREDALEKEYERQAQIKYEIDRMERRHREMSTPVTGSAAGDAALGFGISVLIGGLIDALSGN